MTNTNYITLIMNWLQDNNSTSHIDMTQPYVKRSLRYVFPLFMFLHAVVGLFGLVGNVAILVVLGKRGLYHDQTFFLIGNLAFSDIIKCLFVLPISLANMLIQNWIFGSFMCFFLPMLQLFPIHASMLTFLMIAIDRYRLIVTPFKARVPAGLCTIAVWVGAVCVVLPHAVYMKYIDLGAFLGESFNGVGICFVNMDRHIEEYLRAMFVTLYAMPLAIIGFLCVKVSAELKSRDNASVVVHYSANNDETSRSQSEDQTSKVTWENDSQSNLDRGTTSRKEFTERSTHDSDDDIDLVKEKRTQNYLVAMVTFFAMCWCPMNILILVNYFVHENDDNMGYIDVTYITFSWFGFLSTCVNPILFASWRIPSSTKDRLRGYFRFTNHRGRSSSQVSRTTCTDSGTSPHTPSPNQPKKSGSNGKSKYGNDLSPYHPSSASSV